METGCMYLSEGVDESWVRTSEARDAFLASQGQMQGISAKLWPP